MSLFNFGKKSAKGKSKKKAAPPKKKYGGKSSGGASKKQPPAPPHEPNFWKKLSPDRRMDVIGTGMILFGILMLLTLISAQRSQLTASLLSFLSRIFGWGVYLLPIGLFLVGLWLIFRNAERLPSFSLERGTGLILLSLWLLTAMHAFYVPVKLSQEAALKGVGGGYIGSLLHRMLWNGFDSLGAIISMIAWALIALSLTLDRPVRDLFQWIEPLLARLLQTLKSLRKDTPAQASPGNDIQINGYTPLQRQQVHVPKPEPGTPVTTVEDRQPVIQWALPEIQEILDEGSAPQVNEEFVQQRARLIEETLSSFGAPAQVIEISRGPTITQFGVEPLFVETRSGRTRVRVNKIASLADDLALALSAPRIRIQAPVPGRGFVGIEVPNDEMALVSLRDILESDLFQRKKAPLSFGLGRDVAGLPQITNLENMPHLLIAGTTGSGKSVCVNAILTSLLLHNTPDELRLVLVDPKRVELTGYNGVPHLLAPVIVEVERVVGALQWMTREMDKRYHAFAQIGARNITDYNNRMELQGKKKFPYLVIVIDELADLMMIAPTETEQTITRLAQLARATGIHMILATQRPSVDVLTGLIKANFPARVAFAVASNTDSRVILDQPGAERLLGRGDMLFQAPDAPAPVRLQGVFVSDVEIQRLVNFWRTQAGGGSPYGGAHTGPIDAVPEGVPLKQTAMFDEMKPEEDTDPLLEEAIDLVRREGRASVSMLQRRLRIGYTRAARLVDVMEEKGIVSEPQGGTGVREVLDYGPAAPPKED
ncbi:MAG: DNA translocase FtsK [Anaerolineales bacterium]